MINWYRSWPTEIPEGRAYVHDSMPRLMMSNCDYRTVERWPFEDPGIALLEWDVALALPERQRFAELAMRNPERVLVAPYTKVYEGGVSKQVHRHLGYVPIVEGDALAALFGFGCIYLPSEMVLDFLKSLHRPKQRFTDVTFSFWHLKRFGNVDVTWDVRPAHLHGD